MIRLFGAIAGAGVQVQERTPTPPIEQGPLGTTFMAGIFRSGPTGEAVRLTSGRPQYARIYGGITQDSEAPINVGHFYDMAGGAGELTLLRVTDGTEVASGFAVFDRNVEPGYSSVLPALRLAAQVATYTAHNGGRWAGRRQQQLVILADVSTAITSTSTVATLDTSMLVDQWKGATVTLPGVDATFRGKVTGNTAAGVLTIEGTWSDTIQVSVATLEPLVLELVNEHELTAELEALAIEIADSDEDAATKFSLTAYRDGGNVTAWSDLGLDSAGDSYWLDAINDDPDNYELTPTDLFAGDPSAPLQKPANYAEVAIEGGVVANAITFQITRWSRTGAGTHHLEAITYTGTEKPCTIVLTFTSASAFSVAVTFADGAVAVGLPAGSVGTQYTAGSTLFPAFMIRDNSAGAGDTLTIRCRPLPSDLSGQGGWLYVAAAASEGDVRERYRIANNTHDTVTVSTAIDLTASISAPVAAVATAPTAGDYTLSGGETFIYDAGDGAGNQTLTETLGAGTYTALQLAAELQSLEDTLHTDQARLTFTASSSNEVVVTDNTGTGSGRGFTIRNGTMNSVLGFVADTAYAGTDGQIARLQWQQELGGGYDGIAGIANSDYEVALDVAASKFNDHLGRNIGLVKIAVPGVSAAAVQTAAMAWAYAKNAIAAVEIPDTITTEAGAIAHHEANLAVGAAQDYHFVPFPSYGKIASPYGLGLYTTSMVGAILGLHARKAVDTQGFHLAPAGVNVTLSPLFKELTTGDTRLNNEALNGYGLIEVRKIGASIFLWGDRIPGHSGRLWLHKRATLSHVGRVLLTNTDSLVFLPINGFTFATAKRLLRELFLPWFLTGWFDDIDGPGFNQQVSIKVDDTNNPASERAAGNLHADVAFNVVNTSERVIFTIGPKGVQEAS